MIFVVLIPLLFWAAYHYYHDRHRPEPVGNLLLCIALGVAASYLSKYSYQSLDLFGLRFDAVVLASTNLPGLFMYAVFGIGLIEEFSKMVPFLIFVLRFRDFDEPIDSIVYASFIALGYALSENLYFIQYLSTSESFARGFAGPLVHIVFASVWAYHIGLAKLADRNIFGVTVFWLFATAILHGTYDFIVLGYSQTALTLSALLIVAIWLWRLRLIRRLGQPNKES